MCLHINCTWYVLSISLELPLFLHILLLTQEMGEETNLNLHTYMEIHNIRKKQNKTEFVQF